MKDGPIQPERPPPPPPRRLSPRISAILERKVADESSSASQIERAMTSPPLRALGHRKKSIYKKSLLVHKEALHLAESEEELSSASFEKSVIFYPEDEIAKGKNGRRRDRRRTEFKEDAKRNVQNPAVVYRIRKDGKLGSWLGDKFEGIVAKFKYIQTSNSVCRFLWKEKSDFLIGSIQQIKIDDVDIKRLANLAKKAKVPGLEDWEDEIIDIPSEKETLDDDILVSPVSMSDGGLAIIQALKCFQKQTDESAIEKLIKDDPDDHPSRKAGSRDQPPGFTPPQLPVRLREKLKKRRLRSAPPDRAAARHESKRNAPPPVPSRSMLVLHEEKTEFEEEADHKRDRLSVSKDSGEPDNSTLESSILRRRRSNSDPRSNKTSKDQAFFADLGLVQGIVQGPSSKAHTHPPAPISMPPPPPSRANSIDGLFRAGHGAFGASQGNNDVKDMKNRAPQFTDIFRRIVQFGRSTKHLLVRQSRTLSTIAARTGAKKSAAKNWTRRTSRRFDASLPEKLESNGDRDFFNLWMIAQEQRRVSLTVKSPSAVPKEAITEVSKSPLVQGIKLSPIFVKLLRISGLARPMDTYVVIKACVAVKSKQRHILRHLQTNIKNGVVQVSEDVAWPVKRQATKPIWNSVRRVLVPQLSDEFRMGMKPLLFFQLFAKSNLIKDQEIGRLSVPLSKFKPGVAMSMPLALKVSSGRWETNGGCAVVLQQVNPPPRHKTVFFIRHGESVWNEAQSNLDLGTMFSQTDHGLNQTGLMQAIALQHKIKQAAEADNLEEMKKLAPTERHQKFLSAFLNSDSLFTSPLTRALQTAMVSLAKHPFTVRSKRPNVLTLVSDAREKRNLGGRDTQGQALGQDIVDRALRELSRLFYGTPTREIPPEIRKVGINVNDCTQIWWNTNAESAERFVQRLDSLAMHLGYLQSTSIIVTSHSHFIRAFFKRFISDRAVQQQPDLGSVLQSNLLSNGGVLGLDMEYSSAGVPSISDFCLLFDTKVLIKKKKGVKSPKPRSSSSRSQGSHRRSSSVGRLARPKPTRTETSKSNNVTPKTRRLKPSEYLRGVDEEKSKGSLKYPPHPRESPPPPPVPTKSSMRGTKVISSSPKNVGRN